MNNIWVVIPVFNNWQTVKDVALVCRSYLEHVVVVDDESNGVHASQLFSGSDIVVLNNKEIPGKGRAVLAGLHYAKKQGARFIVTIDADGEYYPQDIEKFIPLLQQEREDIIVIGCRIFNAKHNPGKNNFSNQFSNFWLNMETGVYIDDAQSSFRAYPTKYVSALKLSGMYRDFETEVLTRAVWSGLELKTVAINGRCPGNTSDFSSNSSFGDNLRIFLMHARLLGRRILPFPYPRLIQPVKKLNIGVPVPKNPRKLIQFLLKENATPAGLGVSAATSIFLAVLPILSFHIPVISYVAIRLHLNKVMALAIQNLCMPPFVPIACIQLGHYMRYGRFITEVSWNSVFGSFTQRIWEWFLGSLVLAPLLSLLAGVIVFFIASKSARKKAVYGNLS